MILNHLEGGAWAREELISKLNQLIPSWTTKHLMKLGEISFLSYLLLDKSDDPAKDKIRTERLNIFPIKTHRSCTIQPEHNISLGSKSLSKLLYLFQINLHKKNVCFFLWNMTFEEKINNSGNK